MADEVGAALLRAAGRGVTCRVLLDAIGSADFKKGRLNLAGRVSHVS